MKLHSNATLTVKQRRQIQTIYAKGGVSQQSLAERFGVTRKTIGKWVRRSDASDKSCAPVHPHCRLSSSYRQAVLAWRHANPHHGARRIFHELKKEFSEGSESSVYLILRSEGLTTAKVKHPRKRVPIAVGRHRTQMDIQYVPAIKGGHGFEYKISILHLATRIKYSEIHDNYRSQTIAEVWKRALERLPPFLSPSPITLCVLP
jgi:transposase